MLVLNIPKLYDKKQNATKRNKTRFKAKQNLFEEILRQEIENANKKK